jgi:hypothetical protein
MKEVLLSCAHADEKIAKKVADGLKRAGLRIRDYRREILPGDLWTEKASRALKESSAIVVILTPDAVRSDLVRWEINYALSNVAFKNRLIPVLVGPPDRIPRSEIPWILWDLQMVRMPERGNQEEGIKQIANTLRQVA